MTTTQSPDEQHQLARVLWLVTTVDERLGTHWTVNERQKVALAFTAAMATEGISMIHTRELNELLGDK